MFVHSGAQSVRSAALPKEPTFLLMEDPHHNHTDSSTHSLTKSNTHTAKHPITDAHTPTLSPSDTQTHAAAQSQTDSDTLTDSTDGHLVKHSQQEADTHTAVLVHVQQVSAVQAASTERYEGTAAQNVLFLQWTGKRSDFFVCVFL